MRLKSVKISIEAIFELLKVLDHNEVIPDYATIVKAEMNDDKKVVEIFIHDNEFFDTKEVEVLPVVISNERFNILKETVLTMARKINLDIENKILEEENED